MRAGRRSLPTTPSQHPPSALEKGGWQLLRDPQCVFRAWQSDLSLLLFPFLQRNEKKKKIQETLYIQNIHAQQEGGPAMGTAWGQSVPEDGDKVSLRMGMCTLCLPPEPPSPPVWPLLLPGVLSAIPAAFSTPPGGFKLWLGLGFTAWKREGDQARGVPGALVALSRSSPHCRLWSQLEKGCGDAVWPRGGAGMEQFSLSYSMGYQRLLLDEHVLPHQGSPWEIPLCLAGISGGPQALGTNISLWVLQQCSSTSSDHSSRTQQERGTAGFPGARHPQTPISNPWNQGSDPSQGISCWQQGGNQ